jgi:hypothetical protein
MIVKYFAYLGTAVIANGDADRSSNPPFASPKSASSRVFRLFAVIPVVVPRVTPRPRPRLGRLSARPESALPPKPFLKRPYSVTKK